jgi:Zn-dependent protease with chaperone function
MKTRLLVLALIAASLAPALSAQTTPPPAPAAPSASAAAPSSTYTLTPEKREKAIAYARARYDLHFASFVWSVVVLLVLIAWRLGPKFRDRAEGMAKGRFWQAAIFVPLLLTAQTILELPTGIWGQRLALRYDQSVQGWGSWFWDQAKGLLAGLVVAIPLVWLLYAILRKSPRRWWVWFWLALLPILVFLIFVSPLVFDPLFFKFEPLAPKHPELASKIEEVTVRAGYPISQQKMFEMNASTKNKSINAYVTGLGASKRVVVWDTTIAKATIPQTLFVFGHEMGHDVLNHIPKFIAFLWALAFLTLAISAWALSRLLERPGGRWGIRGVGDWASLPVLLLVTTIVSEISQPAVNGFIRMHEHDADVFGLEAIHGLVPESQRAASEAFQILGETNLSDPDPSPFIRFWLYNHPPLAERLRFAAEYDPWGKGEKPEFLR